MRWRRNSGDALRSPGGSVPSSATLAASVADAPDVMADSDADARRGVEPTFTSPIPVVPLRTQATPTMAQSCARRLNFWNDHPAPARLRHPDLGEQLVGVECRLEETGEEVVDRDLSSTRWPLRDQCGAQGQQHRRKIGRRIAVRDRSADRAAVAHLRIADLSGGVAQQRGLRSEKIGAFEIVMAGQVRRWPRGRRLRGCTTDR